MSPRRRGAQTTLGPRRVRRGRTTGAGANKLAITALPPATFQSAVMAAGCTVRLQTAAGANIALAGVAVTVATPLGSAAALTYTPASVTTDATGAATFTGLQLTGLLGTYTFIFTATGYTSAQATGIQLVAGPAVASTSSASVPSGRVAQTTTIPITLRDAQGNALAVAASGTVTVQVTGTNPVPLTTVPFVAGIGYRFTYTPGTAGTDTVAIKLAGTSIGGSPYTSVVTSGSGTITATSLLMGFASGDIGKGPYSSGGVFTTQEPIFRAHSKATSPGSIDADMALCDNTDSVLLTPPSDSRGNWTTASGSCLIYSPTDFHTMVDRYWTDTALRARVEDYLARRRLIFLVIDEPWLVKFCDSIPPSAVREQARYIKSRFPNCITVARIEPEYVRGGWSGSGTLPINYFDKIDYMFGTYNGRIGGRVRHDPGHQLGHPR